MTKNYDHNIHIRWAFFGTSRFSVIVLERMFTHGFVPCLIVTAEDKPRGRYLVLTPPEVKVWAEEKKIPYIQPKTLRDPEVLKTISGYAPDGFDVFVVASYGKLVPDAILELPKHKTLNIHPSLLPKLRGASPIQSAILNERETGTTIIRLDSEMDHGPILAQEKVEMQEWPPYFEDAETGLAEKSADLLVKILPNWISGNIQENEQDHQKATFCKKIEKTDAKLDMSLPAEVNLRKIRAYQKWPGAYFFGADKKRIKVSRAHMENGELMIDRIVPEGKREMDYKDFLRNIKTN